MSFNRTSSEFNPARRVAAIHLIWEEIKEYVGRRTKDNMCLALGVSYKQRHDDLWNLMFKDYRWINLVIERFRADPVLIGKHLDDLYDGVGSRRGKYLVLYIANDNEGEVQYLDRRLFFDTLQSHQWNPKKGEITFKSGLVLNV